MRIIVSRLNSKVKHTKKIFYYKIYLLQNKYFVDFALVRDVLIVSSLQVKLQVKYYCTYSIKI